MLPKLYRTNHASAPWMVVYSDPTALNRHGKPKRTRFQFARQADATAKHKELLEATHLGGVIGLSFDARARSEWQASRMALDVAGHVHVSLIEVARDWLRNHVGAANAGMPLDRLLADFLQAKERENTEARTRLNLKQRIERWLIDEKLLYLSDIHDRSVLALKQRPGVGPQTRVNDMAAVSSFCTYLVDDRKLLPTHPLKGISRPVIDPRTPRTLTPDQARAFLEAARELGEGRMLRYVILCLFAGLRPSEGAAVLPENVVIERGGGFVRVMRGKRRGHRRQVPLSVGFRAWWKVAPQSPAPLQDANRDRNLFDRIREQAGLIPLRYSKERGRLWQQDICRHTWISMRLAETQDEAAVALEAGTSKEMIHKHYLQWLTPKQAQTIGALRPRVIASGSSPDPV